jgi:hypothetical protein
METKEELINQCNGIEWKIDFVKMLFFMSPTSLAYQCKHEADLIHGATEIDKDDTWRISIALKVLTIRLSKC